MRRCTTSAWWSYMVFVCLMAGGNCSTEAQDAKPAVPQTLTFESDIVPLLQARCVKCHGSEKLEAGLDVRRRFALIKGGDSGSALIIGKPDESLVLERVEKNEMPPPDEGRLDDKQKALLRQWILSGAAIAKDPEAPLEETETPSRISDEDRKFWSFQAPVRPAVPTVQSQNRVRNEIDAFLLLKLEAKTLNYNAEASKEVLLRRLCFDLLGLPPTLEQAEEFANDLQPDAYERLVDRLLEMPQYGERWARHWLDVAGYADSDGYLAADRLRPEAWRYRDYVIDALNRDLPYDQFVREQLAGDELTDWRHAEEITPEVERQLRATGFLRNALDPTYPGYTEPNEIHQVLADTMQIVGSSFLGLTVQCARCHSHKFDPISQRDYYSLQAVFLGALDPARWVPSEVRGIGLATDLQEARITERNKKVDERVAGLTASLNEVTARFRKKRVLDVLKVTLEAAEIEKLAVSLAVKPEQRNAEQKQLTEKYPLPGSLEAENLAAAYPEYRDELARFKSAITAEQALKQSIARIRGLVDLDEKPAAGKIMRRGDHDKPGATVDAGIPEVLALVDFKYQPQSGYKTSGRRAALASWLTDPRNPLLARVQVNRIWAHHFGRGLVPTQANFGRSGVKPTHPELLDWLATEFIRLGWSQKALHRILVTSSAYRQTAESDPAKAAADPENTLIGAWQPRRIEGEVLRDSLLAVAGRLNPQMGGPPSPVAAQGDGSVVDTDDAAGRKRSIYQIVRRSQHMTLLDLFDTPVMEVNCPDRTQSIVPLQALAMWHGPAADRAAKSLADRAIAHAKSDVERVAFVYRLLLGRPPRPTEQQQVVAFLDAAQQENLAGKAAPTDADKQAALAAAWKDAALVLLNSNEFVFVH
jgi:hypothetical protein